jgi:hypothetical protein
VRLTEAAATREEGHGLVAELRRLLAAHRDAGSALASRLLDAGESTDADVWLVEPVAAGGGVAIVAGDAGVASVDAAAEVQPNRNRAVA